jgi:hypothetical protein
MSDGLQRSILAPGVVRSIAREAVVEEENIDTLEEKLMFGPRDQRDRSKNYGQD